MDSILSITKMSAGRWVNCLGVIGVFMLIVLWNCAANAGAILVNVPAAFQVMNAEAAASRIKSDTIAGEVQAAGDVCAIRFSGIQAETSYDVKLTQRDGTIRQGIDTHWHSMEPPKDDAGDISDDDRQQISAIVKEVLSFYNHNDIVLLRGDHQRGRARPIGSR